LTTQASDIIPGKTFRWHGRTDTFCLPSGLDDYPRAPILTEQEAHLDLQMWMIVSTRTLSRVATVLGKTDDAAHYKDLSESFKTVLRDNFWDESRQIYDEFYIDKDG